MSAKRRSRFQRKTEFQEPKKFIFLAMEGKETEPRYFEAFRPKRENPIQIKLVNNPNHKSKPKDVLNRLHACCLTNGFRKGFDKAWIVIDRDSWDETELNRVYRLAKDRGYSTALSNPCFEFWLFLHFRDTLPFQHRHDCQTRLEEFLEGYSASKKSSYAIADLVRNVQDAIDRAKSLDDGLDSWPRRQGTHMYKIMDHLLNDVVAE